jgi:lipid-A-disaccharide synthase
VAVLPGSRGAEIQRLGPPFIGACRLLAAAPATAGVTFVAPMASARLRSLFEQQLKDAGMREQFTVTDGDSETAIAAADVVLLASGTAALEAALLLRPMVAAYRVAPLTYAIARSFRLLKTPHITLPNLLTPTPLVPEFTQQNATPAALAAAVGDLLRDEARREQIAREFSGLREQLRRNADERAADAVLDVIAAAAAR